MTEVRLKKEAYRNLKNTITWAIGWGLPSNVGNSYFVECGQTFEVFGIKFILEEDEVERCNPFGGPFANMGDIFNPNPDEDETATEAFNATLPTFEGDPKDCAFDNLYSEPNYAEIPQLRPEPDVILVGPSKQQQSVRYCCMNKDGFIKEVDPKTELDCRLESLENHVKALQIEMNHTAALSSVVSLVDSVEALQDALASTNIELRSWTGKYEGHRQTTNEKFRELFRAFNNANEHHNRVVDCETQIGDLNRVMLNGFDNCALVEDLKPLQCALKALQHEADADADAYTSEFASLQGSVKRLESEVAGLLKNAKA